MVRQTVVGILITALGCGATAGACFVGVSKSGLVRTGLNGTAIPFAPVSDSRGNSGNADGSGKYTFSFSAYGYTLSSSGKIVTNGIGGVCIPYDTSDKVCASAPGYHSGCSSSGDVILQPSSFPTHPIVKSVISNSSGKVTVVFDQPMDNSSISSSSFSLLDSSKVSQSIAVSYSGATNSAVIATAYPLTDFGSYTLKVANNGDGGSLIYLLNGSSAFYGRFVSPDRISGFGITAVLSPNGSLGWLNGSIWKMLPGAPTFTPGNFYSNLSGKWADTSGNHILVTQYGPEDTAGLSLATSSVPSFTVDYTAGGEYPNIAGNWVDGNNKLVTIIESAPGLSFIYKGGTANGTFNPAFQISAFGLVGTLISDHSIHWSDGTGWTRAAQIVYPNLSGSWIDKTGNAVEVSQFGASLGFQYASGSSAGTMTSVSQISAFGMVGTLLSPTTISWSDSGRWTFVHR